MREAAALTDIAFVARDADEDSARGGAARAQVAVVVRRKGLHRAASLEVAQRMHMIV